MSILPGNYKRLQAAFNRPAEYNQGLLLTYSHSTAPVRSVTIEASAAWAGVGAVTLALPAFTGATAWDDAFGPPAGSAANWFLSATGSNLTSTHCGEGIREIEADQFGSIP